MVDSHITREHSHLPPNTITIGSAVFAGLIHVMNHIKTTNTQTTLCQDIYSNSLHLAPALTMWDKKIMYLLTGTYLLFPGGLPTHLVPSSCASDSTLTDHSARL